VSNHKPRPLQLGSVAQAYLDDLAKHGKATMRRRMRETSTKMIERIIANHKHTQHCNCRPR
jgi:hypothetical protein